MSKILLISSYRKSFSLLMCYLFQNFILISKSHGMGTGEQMRTEQLLGCIQISTQTSAAGRSPFPKNSKPITSARSTDSDSAFLSQWTAASKNAHDLILVNNVVIQIGDDMFLPFYQLFLFIKPRMYFIQYQLSL